MWTEVVIIHVQLIAIPIIPTGFSRMSDSLSPSASAHQFIAEHKTLVLATVSSTSEPLVSYAPFVFAHNEFYVFVSQLAAHTRNLAAGSAAHVMLIHDEESSPNLFGRARLSFYCESQLVDRHQPQFGKILSHFRNKFGPVVSTLESLPDFMLFRLVPGEGNFVQRIWSHGDHSPALSMLHYPAELLHDHY